MESQAGIFDIDLFDYESFTDGLKRAQEINMKKAKLGREYDDYVESKINANERLLEDCDKLQFSKSETDWFLEAQRMK